MPTVQSRLDANGLFSQVGAWLPKKQDLMQLGLLFILAAEMLEIVFSQFCYLFLHCMKSLATCSGSKTNLFKQKIQGVLKHLHDTKYKFHLTNLL